MGEKPKLKAEAINLYYGGTRALGDITAQIPERSITAVIGPSGCGKSSFLRLFNRMNDLIPYARTEGGAFIDELPIYAEGTDVTALRRRVGMVFQKPNVFPMSVFENVVIGTRNHGVKSRAELEMTAERCLRLAALWDEVKDSLKKPGQGLSAGQQQRLCIARALAVNPEVILMDESCSALDPESTMKIEELMLELSREYTIILVTHNMEQAVRVSDMAAFFMIDGDKVGRLVEFSPTADMFYAPKDKRTEDYITGRFG
ncbi:MAG: phosphate ABC transporter ATP-binding protein PstB [Oscillospiraceae bacterium]|nr:phosphate ABC transporter ATP-binding protein PstB [Oscillospiraceae bacterium]